MRNFLYALLIVVSILAAIIVISNWNNILAWFRQSSNEPVPSGPTCQEQYDAAEAEFLKSGQACIQTAVNIACGDDPNFIKSVNPCVEKLLQDKGWQTPQINNSNGNGNGNPNSPSGPADLEVSNPAGAPMYYQTISPKSGGMIYGKSNVTLPVGTKLKLIQFWQTSASNQPLAGFYETDYKEYGPNSGFFDINDVNKV